MDSINSDKNRFDFNDKEDKVNELEIDFREIQKYHEEKKKNKIPFTFGQCEFFFINCFSKCLKKKYKVKRDIVEKGIEITNSYMDITFIIKEFMELNSVKRVLLTNPQLRLLKYQNKYLNLGNEEESMKYLESLESTTKLKGDMFDKDEDIDIDLKMCDGLINYYNYWLNKLLFRVF